MTDTYPTHTIRPRRLERGLTQMQLAAAIGARTLHTIQNWEQGRFNPCPAFQEKLDTVLGPPPQDTSQVESLSVLEDEATERGLDLTAA